MRALGLWGGGALSCFSCGDPAERAQPQLYPLPLVLMYPLNKHLHPHSSSRGSCVSTHPLPVPSKMLPLTAPHQAGPV